MHPHRSVPAAVLLAALSVLGPAVTGCSSGSHKATGHQEKAPFHIGSTTAAATPTATQAGGRTTVTYRATTVTGQAPGDEEMRHAADRLKTRAAALGLTGTTVEVHGTTITAVAPGDAADRLRQMAATADLGFRPVVDPAAAPADVKRRYDALACGSSAPAPAAAPERPMAACDHKSGQKYVLGPVAVGGADVKSAAYALDTTSGGGWTVNLDFTSAGSAKFAGVTGKLAGQTAPGNQFAIVVDGDVLSAPAVQEAITGGKAQITGGFTRESAQNLAALISSGALPVTLAVSDITRQS